MQHVPRLSKPPRMPEGVAAIIDAIGNSARTEILRNLSQRPMSAPELAEVIEAAPRQVLRHLALLEDMGLVTADHPRGDRRAKGRVVLWTTDIARAEEVGRIWLDYVAGRPVPGAEQDA
ncbi:ArsR/SmtB family transcription factor [Nocardioides sp. PD653-B2]|nr:helix-turn-helix domain-containing protein [Nocardioides sp. PD653-B2]